MTLKIPISATISAVGIPITIGLFPQMAIQIGAITAIGTAIVTWHLNHGGRALIRKSPKGTLTFVLDSGRRPAPLRKP